MKPISRRDARLILQFLPLVAGVRWKLWRTPFARLHGGWRDLVQRESESAAASAQRQFPPDEILESEVRRYAQAVRRAARLVPHGSCLTQAMALQLVLARRGEPCLVRIGVNRARVGKPDVTESATGAQPDAAGVAGAAGVAAPVPADSSRFEAHAWVEWRGLVVLGGDISRWKPLTIFAPVAIAAAPSVTAPVAAPQNPTKPDPT